MNLKHPPKKENICFTNISAGAYQQTIISTLLMSSYHIYHCAWAVPYLLYHDDIRAEHFKTSGKEHDVAPTEN